LSKSLAPELAYGHGQTYQHIHVFRKPIISNEALQKLLAPPCKTTTTSNMTTKLLKLQVHHISYAESKMWHLSAFTTSLPAHLDRNKFLHTVNESPFTICQREDGKCMDKIPYKQREAEAHSLLSRSKNVFIRIEKPSQY
jgi:hypothetical protein